MNRDLHNKGNETLIADALNLFKNADGSRGTQTFSGGLGIQEGNFPLFFGSYRDNGDCVKGEQVNTDEPKSSGQDRGQGEDSQKGSRKADKGILLPTTTIFDNGDETNVLIRSVSSLPVGKLYQYASYNDRRSTLSATALAEITDVSRQMAYVPAVYQLNYPASTPINRVSETGQDTGYANRAKSIISPYGGTAPWVGSDPNQDPNTIIFMDEEDQFNVISLSLGHDAENDLLSYKISSLPVCGKLYQYISMGYHKGYLINQNRGLIVTDPDHRITYEPENRTSPYTDTFYCRVNDGISDSVNKERVDIMVNADDDSPCIGDDFKIDPNRVCTMDEENDPIRITFGPCHDAEGQPLTFYIFRRTNFHGRLYRYSASGNKYKDDPIDPNIPYPVAAADPNLTIVYEPENRTSPYTDTFYCRVNDGTSDSVNKERVDIMVNANNDSPWIGRSPSENFDMPTLDTDEDHLLEITLEPFNDKDRDNTTHKYKITLPPKIGKLYQYDNKKNGHKGTPIIQTDDPNSLMWQIINTNNTRVVYEPANYSKPYHDSFSCQVYDGSLYSGNTETINIEVDASNEPPLIVSIPKKAEKEIAYGSQYNYTIIASDKDVDDTLEFKLLSGPNWLKLTNNNNNNNNNSTATLSGTPTILNTGINGNTVIIEVVDGKDDNAMSDTMEFTIDVTVPLPPGVIEIRVDDNNKEITRPTEWNYKQVIIRSGEGNPSALIVTETGTLTIAAGTIVEFQDKLGLIVYGTLKAEGSEDETIIFKGTDWRGIAFTDPNRHRNPNSVSVLSNCTFEGVKGAVGAISAKDYSALEVRQCIISKNEAVFGGGIYLLNSSPTLMDITISYNNALEDGGGIYCENSINPTLTNIIISNNSAMTGGGIYCKNSKPVLINNLITNNRGISAGGGIYCESSHPTLIYNTISKNLSEHGAGIYCGSSNPEVRDTILFGNSKTNNRDEQVYLDANSISNSNPAFYYCDVQGGVKKFGGKHFGNEDLYPDDNNVDLDPQFVSPSQQAGVIVNFVPDWSLLPTSPCINAGDPDKDSVTSNLDPESVKAAGYDLAGTGRPFRSTGNSDIDKRYRIYSDIGAYEFKDNPPFVAKEPNDVTDIPIPSITDNKSMVLTLRGGYDFDDPTSPFPNPNLLVKMVLLSPYPSGNLYQYISDENGGTYKRGTVLSVSNPIIADPDRRVIYVPANCSSTYTDTFYFKVSDGQMDSPNMEKVMIDVEGKNERPFFTTSPITSGQAFYEYFYQIKATDPDMNDILGFDFIKGNRTWLNLEDKGNGTAVLSGTPNLAGDYPVILRVHDQELYSDQNFVITITSEQFSVNAGPDKSGAPTNPGTPTDPNYPIVLEATVSGCDMTAYNWELTWKIYKINDNGSTSMCTDENSIGYPANPFKWKPMQEGIYKATVTVSNVTDEITLIIADGFADVDDYSLDSNGRSKALATIMKKLTDPNIDLTDPNNSLNRQLGALDNLVIENPAPSNYSFEALTDDQIKMVLDILEGVADFPDLDVMDNVQIYKAVEVLNEMINQRGGRYLSSDQAAQLTMLVKKIAREGACLPGDLQANSYDSIQISASTIDLTKVKCEDPNVSKSIGSPSQTDAQVIFPAGTMCEIKSWFGIHDVKASITANKATGSGPGIIVSVSLAETDGTDLHITNLANPIEIHIPVTDKSKRTPMCFDEASGIWSSKGISEVSDLNKDVVTFKTSHLSDFALFDSQTEGKDSKSGSLISKLDSGCFIESIAHRIDHRKVRPCAIERIEVRSCGIGRMEVRPCANMRPYANILNRVAGFWAKCKSFWESVKRESMPDCSRSLDSRFRGNDVVYLHL